MNVDKNVVTAATPPLKGMAPSPDVWLTTRARIVLLTTQGITLTDGLIETHEGVVTLHGSVESYAEQQRAGDAVSNIDGVKGVRNYLKVVGRPAHHPTDQEIQARVERALRTDASLAGLKVAAVDQGVVRLTGKGVTLTSRLRAIELLWNVPGVATEDDPGSTDSTDPNHTAA